MMMGFISKVMDVAEPEEVLKWQAPVNELTSVEVSSSALCQLHRNAVAHIESYAVDDPIRPIIEARTNPQRNVRHSAPGAGSSALRSRNSADAPHYIHRPAAASP